MSNESVEQRPSETAIMVAFSRALAAKDERAEIRGRDYLAHLFLPEDRQNALKDPAKREWVKSAMPPGIYAYFIARTAYFDLIVEQGLRALVPQMVFLGAGYDSRPYRFSDLNKGTRIFEVDIHTTQLRKIEVLRQAKLAVPEQLTFVPVNFKTDSLKDVLLQAGYDKNLKTLFIWEGVTYYLMPHDVDSILNFIKFNSPDGSSICFDYSASNIVDGYGVKELRSFMRTNVPGEPTPFGLEDGKVKAFLSERDYKIVDHLMTEDMERKYLTLHDGSCAGKVTALFRLVHAAVATPR